MTFAISIFCVVGALGASWLAGRALDRLFGHCAAQLSSRGRAGHQEPQPTSGGVLASLPDVDVVYFR